MKKCYFVSTISLIEFLEEFDIGLVCYGELFVSKKGCDVTLLTRDGGVIQKFKVDDQNACTIANHIDTIEMRHDYSIKNKEVLS